MSQAPGRKFIWSRLLPTLSIFVALTVSAHSQTIWTGTATSDWFTPGNWTAGVPTGTTNAVIDTIDPNSTIVVAPATAQNAEVGKSGTGTLNITSGGVAGSPMD